MAEGVDAVAVDLGDRAGRAELEVAGDERDADRIAGTQRLLRPRGGILAAGARHHRQESLLAERGGQRIDHRRVEAADRQRRRDRTQHRPDAGIDAGAEHLDVGRIFRERAHPRERLAQRCAHAFRGQRHLQVDTAGLSPRRRRKRRVLDHLVDRRDARDRFLGELAERIRDGADEPAVDIDGAAAHPGNHARVGQRSAFELGENQVAARADDVAQHAEDVDLEFIEPITLEHGAADADHARLELVDGKCCGGRRNADANEEQQGGEGSQGADFHRVHSR